MSIANAQGSRSPPGSKALNARGPLKVHPKWRLEESALAPRALAPIGRHMTARETMALWLIAACHFAAANTDGDG